MPKPDGSFQTSNVWDMLLWSHSHIASNKSQAYYRWLKANKNDDMLRSFLSLNISLVQHKHFFFLLMRLSNDWREIVDCKHSCVFCFWLFEFIKFLQFHSVQRLHLQRKRAALLFINVAQQQLYSWHNGKLNTTFYNCDKQSQFHC